MPSKLGATYLGDGRTEFLVWAPRPKRVEVRLSPPDDRVIEMESLEHGYRHAVADRIEPGASPAGSMICGPGQLVPCGGVNGAQLKPVTLRPSQADAPVFCRV